VRYCLDKGCELGDLKLDELKQFGSEFEEDFFDAVTLEATLDCHDVIGGTARNRVKAALVEADVRVQAIADVYGSVSLSETKSIDGGVIHAGA